MEPGHRLTHGAPSVIETIGDTPLIRLRRASAETKCEIWGKAEFLNPGQSVKDRAALYIIRDAERRGALRPGGVIAVDNVLWSGRVIDPNCTDRATTAVREFNQRVFADSRVAISVIPIGDGLTLARKL